MNSYWPDGSPRNDIEPPDWYLDQAAERDAERHSRDAHGGGDCDCPVIFADEAPF